MVPHSGNSQILIWYRPLVWRKLRGHFERQNQQQRFYFFTQDQIFYLKFSLTTWLLQFKPLLFLHSCSERTSELLFCNFPNCLPTRKSWHAFASRKLQPQLNWIFIQNLLKILWTDQNTCRDCKPLSHTLWFMNFSCVLPTSCAVY